MSIPACSSSTLPRSTHSAPSLPAVSSTTEKVAQQSLATSQTKSTKKKKKKRAVHLPPPSAPVSATSTQSKIYLPDPLKRINNLFYLFVIKTKEEPIRACEVYCVPLNILSDEEYTDLESKAQPRHTPADVARRTLQAQYKCPVYDITSNHLSSISFSGGMTGRQFLANHRKTFKALFDLELSQAKIERLSKKIEEINRERERINLKTEQHSLEIDKKIAEQTLKLEKINKEKDHLHLEAEKRFLEIDQRLAKEKEKEKELEILLQKIEEKEKLELEQIAQEEKAFLHFLSTCQDEPAYPFHLPLEMSGEMLCYQILFFDSSLENEIKMQCSLSVLYLWEQALYYIHSSLLLTDEFSFDQRQDKLISAYSHLTILLKDLTHRLEQFPSTLNKLSLIINSWRKWLERGYLLSSEEAFHHYLLINRCLLPRSSDNYLDFSAPHHYAVNNPLKLSRIFCSYFGYLESSLALCPPLRPEEREKEEYSPSTAMLAIKSCLEQGEWNQAQGFMYTFNMTYKGLGALICPTLDFIHFSKNIDIEQFKKIWQARLFRSISVSFGNVCLKSHAYGLFEPQAYFDFKHAYELAKVPFYPAHLEPLTKWLHELHKHGYPGPLDAFNTLNLQRAAMQQVYDSILMQGNPLSNFIEQYEQQKPWKSHYEATRIDLLNGIIEFKKSLILIHKTVECIQIILTWAILDSALPSINKKLLQKQFDLLNQDFRNYAEYILKIATKFHDLFPGIKLTELEIASQLAELKETADDCRHYITPFLPLLEVIEKYTTSYQKMRQAWFEKTSDNQIALIKEMLKTSFEDTKTSKVMQKLEELLNFLQLPYRWEWGAGDHKKLYIGQQPPIVFPQHKEWKKGTAQSILKQTIHTIFEALLQLKLSKHPS